VNDSNIQLSTLDDNGFTMTVVDNPAAILETYFLAIKGGRHSVGAFDAPSTWGDQATTTLGYQPNAILFAAASSTASGSVFGGSGATNSGAMTLGVASSTTAQGMTWFQGYNADSTTNAGMHSTTTKVVAMMEVASTIRAHADLASLNITGRTLNWKKASSSATQIFYWAIGNRPVTMTVLGNAYDDEQSGDLAACDDSTGNIAVIIGTSSPGKFTTSCANSGNAFTASITGTNLGDISVDTPIIGYIDGVGSTYGSRVGTYASGMTKVTAFTIQKVIFCVRTSRGLFQALMSNLRYLLQI